MITHISASESFSCSILLIFSPAPPPCPCILIKTAKESWFNYMFSPIKHAFLGFFKLVYMQISTV